MTVKYNGKTVATDAATVAEFLDSQGVNRSTALVEFGDEAYGAGADLSALKLSDGAEINVFKMVSGG